MSLRSRFVTWAAVVIAVLGVPYAALAAYYINYPYEGMIIYPLFNLPCNGGGAQANENVTAQIRIADNPPVAAQNDQADGQGIWDVGMFEHPSGGWTISDDWKCQIVAGGEIKATNNYKVRL